MTQDWEKAFNERFKDPEWLRGHLSEDSMLIASRADIKAFIASLLADAKREGAEEAVEYIGERDGVV